VLRVPARACAGELRGKIFTARQFLHAPISGAYKNDKEIAGSAGEMDMRQQASRCL
jgi:hypothetical protein